MILWYRLNNSCLLEVPVQWTYQLRDLLNYKISDSFQLWGRDTRCAATVTPTLLHLVHYLSGDCMSMRSNQTNQFPATTGGVKTVTTKIHSMFQVLLAAGSFLTTWSVGTCHVSWWRTVLQQIGTGSLAIKRVLIERYQNVRHKSV
jgi:hypothetical protein